MARAYSAPSDDARGPVMAKAARGAARSTATGGGHKSKGQVTGLWTKRNTATGRFVEVRKSGDAFKGVRKEN